jgi:hypothetical protein
VLLEGVSVVVGRCAATHAQNGHDLLTRFVTAPTTVPTVLRTSQSMAGLLSRGLPTTA